MSMTPPHLFALFKEIKIMKSQHTQIQHDEEEVVFCLYNNQDTCIHTAEHIQ